MPTIFDVADYITAKFQSARNELDDELMTQVKLQTLVYYAQGLSLGFYNESLFDETLEAWEDGPVYPSLYHNYDISGNYPIKSDSTLETISQKFTTPRIKAMDTAVSCFGVLSESRSRELACQDEAWCSARNNNDKTISLESLRNSFVKQLTIHDVHVNKLTSQELAYQRKLADDLGLPDSLDYHNE
jgi:uncharacterized phage-associated protein